MRFTAATACGLITLLQSHIANLLSALSRHSEDDGPRPAGCGAAAVHMSGDYDPVQTKLEQDYALRLPDDN
jgi:hypothetical protein